MISSMASAVLFLCLLAFASFQPIPTHEEPICPFQSIYQFGDSISDVGNLIRLGPIGEKNEVSRLPYGETYFHWPTGRASDGLLLIDFLAKALHLPLLNPYLERNASFDHGVNFAVAGSTALDSSFFAARNISISSTNSPLNVQLGWFRNHLNSVCHSPVDCHRKLRRALFMMGEIGGNDYNNAFIQGKPIEEIRTYVPCVVGAITDAVREVIRLGAIRIVVPGMFPQGCFPVYLTSFPSRNPSAYDDKGCLNEINKFVSYHNRYLQGAIAMLRMEYPHVVILYADYYTTFESVLRNPALGFDQRTLLRACCGKGGLYNFNNSMRCASPGVPVCPDPHQYISWDGIHLTQEGYSHMSEMLIPSILSTIQMCSVERWDRIVIESDRSMFLHVV